MTSRGIFSMITLKIGSKIYLDFNQKDVLEFDSSCSTFFTN